MHVKNERARVMRQIEQLLKSWEELDPKSALAFRAAQAALQVLGAPAEDRYKQFRSTKQAVTALLEFENEWLPKQVIADKLFEGGFVMDPEVGRRLAVQSITRNVERGHFAQDDEKRVGLLQWVAVK